MILTVTLNPALDKTLVVPSHEPETTLRATEVIHLSGGKGLNVSRALIGLGVETVALFPQAGHTGEHLQAVCEAEGLPTRPVPVSGETRLAITARDGATGRYYHYLEPGPELSVGDLQLLKEAFVAALSEAEAVIISGSVPCASAAPLIPWMVAAARARKVPCALDTHGKPLVEGLRAGPWLAKPNQQELELALGRSLADEEARGEALHWMREAGVELPLLSLGAEGLLALSDGRILRVIPPSVPVVNELGAGDATVAGVVSALVAGASVEEALFWAVACGAANVAVWDPGAITREVVQELLPGVTMVRA